MYDGVAFSFTGSKTSCVIFILVIKSIKCKQNVLKAHRVATCQGKVREKQNFLQVRELSENFEKMSGNFGHLTNVREMSGNFVMAIKFF